MRTPEEIAEAFVNIEHPCDEGCCPEALLSVVIRWDGHADEDAPRVRGFVSLEDTLVKVRRAVMEIVASERAAARAAALEEAEGVLLTRAKDRGLIADRIAKATRNPNEWRDYEIRQDECHCAADDIRALLRGGAR